MKTPLLCLSTITIGQTLSLISAPTASASDNFNANAIYEVGELFELGIQLSYLLLLLAFLGVGSFFVIRQVLVRRELDLSAKELQVIPVSYIDALLMIMIFSYNFLPNCKAIMAILIFYLLPLWRDTRLSNYFFSFLSFFDILWSYLL